MATIKPTRMGLLLVKKKLKLASKGHKLLKDKQDALVLEFFAVMKEIKRIRKEISKDLHMAQKSLFRAQALSGTKEIDEIANGLSQETTMNMTVKSIMGVKIPTITDIKINDEWYGYLTGNLELDNAVNKYRKFFPSFMKLVEKQIALNNIAEDIKKTRRKVNSLEYTLIPKLKKLKSTIAFKLEEQERENFTRLKKIKEKSSK